MNFALFKKAALFRTWWHKNPHRPQHQLAKALTVCSCGLKTAELHKHTRTAYHHKARESGLQNSWTKSHSRDRGFFLGEKKPPLSITNITHSVQRRYGLWPGLMNLLVVRDQYTCSYQMFWFTVLRGAVATAKVATASSPAQWRRPSQCYKEPTEYVPQLTAAYPTVLT